MMFLVVVCSLLLSTVGKEVEDDWLDPYDMLNYDASTKTMRKPAEPTSYSNVVTKRREYVQEPSQEELTSCKQNVVDLQRQIDELKKEMTLMSQQPTCNPVFKRFLSRLLKEIQRVGAPIDSTEIFYDAKIKLSRQAMMEIQSLLEGEDRWRTGALDNAVSHILVDLKPHDYEVWKWHFEDSFGVELDTVLKIGVFVLIISTTISTQLWSVVSWFVQFRRLFAVCFFVSIIWNWFYLYKIAFAEHQNNIAKMDSVNEKCTGVKKIDWSDSLKEWFRSTWTLQDDPCKKYYEVLMVNPILLVPPTKAISVTITTFLTEPLKHFGQGISEFLRALLKDLPVTLQIPVLLTIVLAILVVMYGSVQAAFQHGIMAPLRRPRRDPPPPELQQPQPYPLMVENRGNLAVAGGDAPAPAAAPTPAPAPAQQHVPRYRANDARLYRNNVHQRRPTRVREEPQLVVETLRTAELYSGDETDAERHEESPEIAENLPEQSESENQQETQEEADGASSHSNATHSAQSKPKHTESDSSQSKNKPLKGKEQLSPDEPKEGGAAERSEPASRKI
ncbi:chloride channel CLIC-like protein 1 isoform X2 [Melanotaenia boesemani]|uniref:chloride channel CLIC-like protein 1 isoform X2 n=1 Tax=Melanotaenia boesemani TaxID=1250792 RepID=UPI001C057BF3|nr:chloride channel CLIC-like protein 1 isoform X2 [Melanotaenia boesemani]XP_041862973.1 chloride channel CLIC-like protein 1 isoform X2 [Melanotaenia boesemani]